MPDKYFLLIRLKKPDRALLPLALTVFCGFAGSGDSCFLFNVLCCISAVAMCVSLVGQIRAASGHTDIGRRQFHILFAAIALYLVSGIFLPFLYQPQVSTATEESVAKTEFYSDTASGERARVLSRNGEALEERIRLISQAEEEIILSTFEMDADTSGRMVMSALMEAADRGVSVYVLMDGFSYLHALWGNPYFLAFAQTENIEVKIYNPVCLWKPWTLMGRLHDKYLIADDLGYILGGRNTYDYFLGDQEGKKNYDWDVLVYSAEAGEASLNQLKEYFYSVWDKKSCKTAGKSSYWADNPTVKDAAEILADVYVSMQEAHAEWMEPSDYEAETVPVNHIELVSNPTHIFSKEPVVFYTITELMLRAEESIDFHTPYVICNKWMLNRLEAICDAVDEVTMMTNSVANNGNLFGAADYLVNKGKILETGVQVLEYEGSFSYHGKCFAIDDRLSAVGSYNWDMRSTYLDTELMLVIDSEDFNGLLREEMEQYEESALKVVDTDTSVAPAGTEAKELGTAKRIALRIVNLFYGARYLM